VSIFAAYQKRDIKTLASQVVIQKGSLQAKTSRGAAGELSAPTYTPPMEHQHEYHLIRM
jgi:hypothetical protein